LANSAGKGLAAEILLRSAGNSAGKGTVSGSDHSRIKVEKVVVYLVIKDNCRKQSWLRL